MGLGPRLYVRVRHPEGALQAYRARRGRDVDEVRRCEPSDLAPPRARGCPLIWVRYECYDNGLVRLVSQGGAARTAYYYDEANQLLRIEHQSTAGNLPHLVYTYNARGLPKTSTEFNHLRYELAGTTFT